MSNNCPQCGLDRQHGPHRFVQPDGTFAACAGGPLPNDGFPDGPVRGALVALYLQGSHGHDPESLGRCVDKCMAKLVPYLAPGVVPPEESEAEVPSKGGGPSPAERNRTNPASVSGAGALDESQKSATADSAPLSGGVVPSAPSPSSAEFLTKYESIGHWCPEGDVVRPFSFSVCSMCMGKDAVQIVQPRGLSSAAAPSEMIEMLRDELESIHGANQSIVADAMAYRDFAEKLLAILGGGVDSGGVAL